MHQAHGALAHARHNLPRLLRALARRRGDGLRLARVAHETRRARDGPPLPRAEPARIAVFSDAARLNPVSHDQDADLKLDRFGRIFEGRHISIGLRSTSSKLSHQLGVGQLGKRLGG